MRFIIFIICSVCAFATTSPVFAAVIKLESDFGVLHVGDVVVVHVGIDTEGQSMNAVESQLVFPQDLLHYLDSDDSESVVNLWMEKPTIHDDNTIHFAGVTPGGFTESNATVATLRFRVIGLGQDMLRFSNTSVLKNDSNGTALPVIEQSLHISVVSGVASVNAHTVDVELPEDFTPQIVTDPDLFEGRPALVFVAQDKGSGIDHYEVKEGWWGRYVVATSPYEIRNQKLDVELMVKAIDRLGNERIEVLYPQSAAPWYKQEKILGTIVVLCVLMFFGWWWRRGRRSRS